MEQKKLTPKQAMFVKEYLIDLNATQAAIRAGYSKKTAGTIGEQNLRKLEIQKSIAQEKQKRNEELKIDAQYVLRRLTEIDRMDVSDILDSSGNIKRIVDWPKSWRCYISEINVSEMFQGGGEEKALVGVLKKIKWPDKLKNLELLGKHVTVQAFKEQIANTHELDIAKSIKGVFEEVDGKTWGIPK